MDDLPRVDPTRLQRVVADIEFNKPPFKTFDDLCYKVAAGNWANEMELDAKTIGALIVHHNTITKTPKPKPQAEPPPPAPAPPTEPPPVKPEPEPVAKAPAKKKAKDKPPEPPVEPPPAPPKKKIPKPEPPAQQEVTPPPAPVEEKKAPEPVTPPTEKVEGPVVAEEPPSPPSPPPVAEPHPIVNADVTVYPDGGRGRKQCPKCKRFVGNRAEECACGHEFQKDSPAATSHTPISAAWARREQLARAAASGYGCSTVLCVPAGKPPVELKKENITEKSVREWAEANRDERKRKDGYFLSLEALLYWSSMACEPNDDQKKVVRGHLLNIFPDEVWF